MVLDNFSKGVFVGTTHTYLGQEANAVAVLEDVQPQDIVFSNHRCHGHFLAYGGNPRALFAELMGRATGVCGGRGGSQHLHWRNFYSNGVQGGIAPISVGMALAEKRRRTGAVAIAFMGDGTLGQGVVYEAFNLAVLWQAPVWFVIEDNRIAQTTPTELALAGDMAARLRAFGLPVDELDSSDVTAIAAAAAAVRQAVRHEQRPRALILHTCRFGPHSKGDDTRSAEQVADLRRRRDPLTLLAPAITPTVRQAIQAEVETTIAAAYQAALQDPFPTP
jgi:TPP-dependent pyruvate/acetoin dehydrogenase alpha subunit